MLYSRIENKIAQIVEWVEKEYEVAETDLYSGCAGVLLFYYHAMKSGFAENQSVLQKLLDEIIAKPSSNVTLSHGHAGINWLLSYLVSERVLSYAQVPMLKSNTEDLMGYAADYMMRNDYDLLHGGLGIAYSCLFKVNTPELFEKVNKSLTDICGRNSIDGVAYPYDFQTLKPNANEVNMGFAHGIAGILKYLLQCHNLEIDTNRCEVLATDIITFIRRNQLGKDSESMFPAIVTNGEKSNYSRLGWCYGDLTIAVTLYQAGVRFNDGELIAFAIKILRHSTSRRDLDKASIKDAGICHGSAGVAYIFYKMWYCTKEILFKKCAEYWIEKTLNLACHSEGIAGYMRYQGHSKVHYVTNSGLLEGTAGIGLVLMSYLTNDFNWDYSIMLN